MTGDSVVRSAARSVKAASFAELQAFPASKKPYMDLDEAIQAASKLLPPEMIATCAPEKLATLHNLLMANWRPNRSKSGVARRTQFRDA